MTICPCCGFKFHGVLSNGCNSCGARSVGEPLPKPEHELPSYGRSLLLAVLGSLMALAFLTETIIALTKNIPISIDFFSLLTAGQIAAWRLKWVAIPTMLVLWGARKLYRSMLRSPELYCGMRYAKVGFLTSAAIPVLIAVLIGVTIPERLLQRQLATEAAENAKAYTFARAFLQYQEQFDKMPVDLTDLRQVPDPDGSIGAALDSLNLDPKDYAKVYKPSADVAAALTKPERRPTMIKASLTDEVTDPVAEGLAFNKYTLRLPGPDKLYGTEDDLIVRDGMITRAADSPKPVVTTSSATTVLKP